MPETEGREEPKKIERVGFREGEDFIFQDAYIYENNTPIRLRRLTNEGKAKLEAKRKELFGDPEMPHLQVPLQKGQKLAEGDIVELDMLLALSIIRKKNGGYLCTLKDDFEDLKTKKISAAIQKVSEDGINLIFESWPDEYLQTEFVTPKLGVRPTGNPEIISEPITIGPSAKTSLNTLETGRPNESFIGWAKNAIKRNLPTR